MKIEERKEDDENGGERKEGDENRGEKKGGNEKRGKRKEIRIRKRGEGNEERGKIHFHVSRSSYAATVIT